MIWVGRRLPLEFTTIAQALKASGYATGMFGKWHLGQHTVNELANGCNRRPALGKHLCSQLNQTRARSEAFPRTRFAVPYGATWGKSPMTDFACRI